MKNFILLCLFTIAAAPATGEPRGAWWDVKFRPHHSTLAPPPRWDGLERWQDSITRERFGRLLREIYGPEGGGWEPWIEIQEDHAQIRRATAQPDAEPYLLRFAPECSNQPARYWRSPAELGPAPQGRPLHGLHVALDPGHLGGRFSLMEFRHFQIGNDPPVREGDMVLQVARLLKTKLEALGAHVSLLRDGDRPVTRLRPHDLKPYALDMLKHGGTPKPTPDAIERLANRTFVVNAEIRARAAMVNDKLRPDLVLCLHFNAEAWGAENKPVFSKFNHLHVLVHGSVTRDEWGNDDERFDTLARMLQRTHEVEIPLGLRVADSLATATGLQPFIYKGPNARAVSDSPFLWARNLLANRTFHCPVIFLEPHVMNHDLTYRRIMAGSYEGLREFGGIKRENIFLEYARAVADGVALWYAQERGALETTTKKSESTEAG